MIEKGINIVFQISFFLILLFLFISSVKVVFSNIRNFNNIKGGVIIDVRYLRYSEIGNEKGVFEHKILIQENDTITGSSQYRLPIGDSVMIRYIGKAGNIIFKHKGMKIRSKWDTWDKLSPFVLVFSIFMIFNFIQLWVNLIKNR